MVSLALYVGLAEADRPQADARRGNLRIDCRTGEAGGNPLLLQITKEGKGHAKIGIPEIEDIATGAALLGAVVAVIPMSASWWPSARYRSAALSRCWTRRGVPDDALVVPIAMMGADGTGGEGHRRQRIPEAL